MHSSPSPLGRLGLCAQSSFARTVLGGNVFQLGAAIFTGVLTCGVDHYSRASALEGNPDTDEDADAHSD